jgi:hypothetical protein
MYYTGLNQQFKNQGPTVSTQALPSPRSLEEIPPFPIAHAKAVNDK